MHKLMRVGKEYTVTTSVSSLMSKITFLKGDFCNSVVTQQRFKHGFEENTCTPMLKYVLYVQHPFFFLHKIFIMERTRYEYLPKGMTTNPIFVLCVESKQM